MKLTKNNIDFVKALEMNGVIYEWFIKLKNGETKIYINMEKGKTIVSEYLKEWLPVSIIQYIDQHEKEEISKEEEKNNIFKRFIWK